MTFGGSPLSWSLSGLKRTSHGLLTFSVSSLPEATDDQHQICMAWKGLRHGPKEVMDRLYRGETVDPRSYYFRTTPYFETSSEKYGWMTRICAIATGSLGANARALDVFQVL